MDSMQNLHSNALHEMSQKLLTVEQQREQLNVEKKTLKAELEELSAEVNQRNTERSIGKPWRSVEQVPIHEIVPDATAEIQQLHQQIITLTDQLAQLEAANRAWQQYQHDQVEAFRQRLQPDVPTLEQTENASLDSMAQQILNQLNELHVERDNLRRQMDYLRDEVQAQKQKLGKTSPTETLMSFM